MSEAKTKIEIEDVLSSIRRLVSQDAAVTHHPARAALARRPEPVAAAVPVAEALPEVVEIAEDPVDECLVLTPALRVEEPGAEGDAPAAAPMVEAIAETADEIPEEAEDLGDELSRLESTIAEMEAAVAESGIAFEPELGDHFEADGLPALEVAEEAAIDTPEVATTEEVAAATQTLEAAEAFIWTRALSARAGARPIAEPHPEVATEAVIAEIPEEAPQAVQLVAEGGRSVFTAAHRAEEDLILEAEILQDLPSEDPVAAEALEVMSPEALEAVSEEAFGDALPEGDPEEMGTAEDADVTVAEELAEVSGDFDMAGEIEQAEEVEEPTLATVPAEEALVEDALAEEALAEEQMPADHDPDLQDAAWDEAETADWAVEGEDEDLPEIDGEVELPDLETDLMDAATQEAAAELRRAHLSDAMAERPDPEVLRSSYDSLRDDYAAGGYGPADIGAEDGWGSGEAGYGAIVDEEALQALVADLIRRELRGALGERITQNVRKLVRREIQRALMNRDYE
ncbi:MAG: hypothetical protein IE922_01260 [Sphingomonadales bacterium]|nr:hypothetical protein [Sphingomonadales bacterium]